MGILKEYFKGIANIRKKWDLKTKNSNKFLTSVLFVPIVICIIFFAISIFIGFVVGRILIRDFIMDVFFLLVSILTVVVFIRGKFIVFGYLLIGILGTISLICFYLWGILHYIGIIFGVLFLSLCFYLLKKEWSIRVALIYLVSVPVIGILESLKIIKYLSDWSPEVFIYDTLIISICFVLISHVIWIYHTHSENQVSKIHKLVDDLKFKNEVLNKRVLKQTVKLMQSNLKLDESKATLSSAYHYLNKSEKERFSQMNKLALIAMGIGKKVHNIRSPLMCLLNEISNLRISSKMKTHLAVSFKDITNELDSIREELTEKTNTTSSSLGAIFTNVVEILSWKFNSYNVPIPNLNERELKITGDMTKLKHVLTNVLDNALEAVKGKENPQIMVKAISRGDGINISITDNGEGVTDKNQKKLFTEFFTTRENGCGLGLYISKKYIEETWGGKITYARESGLTVFSVSIPNAESKGQRDLKLN